MKCIFYEISYSSHKVILIVSSRVEREFNSLSIRPLRLKSDSKEKNHFFHVHHTKKYIHNVMSTKKMCFFVWWAWKKWFFSFESLINLSRRVERELNFFSTRELRIEITSWEEYEIPWNVFFRMMNMKKMIFFFWISLQSKWTSRNIIKLSLDSLTQNQNYFMGKVWNFMKCIFLYDEHK